MHHIKNKRIVVFANGSLLAKNTFFKELNKTKIYDKDHTNFSCYQKKSNQVIDSKNFISFKTKYLNF